MDEKLSLYNDVAWECVKCTASASEHLKVEFNKGDIKGSKGFVWPVDYLSWTCKMCGYRWMTHTADYKEEE